MSEARPPITLRAGFSYSRKRFVAEVAVVQSEGAGGAAAACGPSLDGITVGWGEVDAAGGAVCRKRKFEKRETERLREEVEGQAAWGCRASADN